MTLDQAITPYLTYWWLGFSMTYVILGSLWSFIEGPASRMTPWSSVLLRGALLVMVGIGPLVTAMLRLPNDDGLWTGLTLWLGIFCGFVVAVCLLGDPRRWGKKRSL